MNHHASALRVLLIVALVSGDPTWCTKTSIEESAPAYWPTHDWKHSPPEEQGLVSTHAEQDLNVTFEIGT